MKLINIQDKWKVIYFTYNDPVQLIINTIEKISNSNADWVLDVYDKINYGFTNSFYDKRISVVFIGKQENKSEFYSTFTHELKHVQSHICEYYEVNESGEEAAYLIGYLAKLIIQ